MCTSAFIGGLPGRRGFRLHPNAVIRVHDTITPYHDLAGDALRRNKAAVEIAQQAVGAFVTMRLGPVELQPKIMLGRVVLLPLVVLDKDVGGTLSLGEDGISPVSPDAIAHLQVAGIADE